MGRMEELVMGGESELEISPPNAKGQADKGANQGSGGVSTIKNCRS